MVDKWDSINEKLTILASSQSQLRERVDVLVKTVDSHTAIINKMSDTHAMTQEIRDYLESAKGFFKVIGWGHAFVTWLWPIAAFGIAVWVFIKTGKWDIKP